jgi:hypothetical protein
MNIKDLLTVENIQRNLMLYRTIKEFKEELNLESRKLTTKQTESNQTGNRTQ